MEVDNMAQASGVDGGYSIDYYKSQMRILLLREKELQETQRRLQHIIGTLLSLQKISRFLKGATNIEEGISYALHTLATEANYERAVSIVKRSNGDLHVFSQGYSREEQHALQDISSAQLEEFLGEVHETKESALLIQPATSSIGKTFFPQLHFDTCLLALITDNDKTVGLIAAGYSPDQAKYFAPVLRLEKDDTVWFDELAHQISSTIVGIELLDSLRAEQARLSASINSLASSFMIVSLAHDIIFNNTASSTVLGVNNATTMHDIARSFPDIDVIRTAEEATLRKEPIDIPDVLYGKKILRLYFGPVIKDGEVICYIFLAEDITEAKSIERSRDEFFSIASHELRTPLTAIRGNVSLLEQYYGDRFPESDRQMLTDIKAASVRLIKIVNDFLQVSRLEQSRLLFNVQPTDIAELVQQVVSEMKPLADTKKLYLHYNRPPSSPLIKADSDRAKEVIVNLIGNAINYTREGGVDIEIVQRPGEVTILVKDTGVGIPPQNQSLLFRKFQQAGDILSRDVSQSTGLGLYISKLMTEAMHGTIQLEESIPDKGSTFSLTLPAAEPQNVNS